MGGGWGGLALLGGVPRGRKNINGGVEVVLKG